MTDQNQMTESTRIDELVSVALRLFLDRGYDNTPMSLVAKELGLTKAGVYHHLESKEHLLYTVHKHMLERMLIPILDKVEGEVDPLARLESFIAQFAALLTRDPAPGVLIHETRRLSPKHSKEIRKVWRRLLDLVRESILELQRQGRCRADLNPTFAAFALIGMVSWISNWFDYAKPGSANEVVRTIADIFMNGILEGQKPHLRQPADLATERM